MTPQEIFSPRLQNNIEIEIPENSSNNIVTPTGSTASESPCLSQCTDKSSSFLAKMRSRLKRQFEQHVAAATYYKKMNILVSVPSLVLTGFASVASFLSTSAHVSSDAQTGFAISVGIVSAISTILQTFASGFRYPSRIESHSVAGNSYNNLKTQVEFEKDVPNEQNLQIFADKLEQQILEIQQKTNYFVPEWIREKYSKKK